MLLAAEKRKKTSILVVTRTPARTQESIKFGGWGLELEADFLKKILPRNASLIAKNDAYFPTDIKKLKTMRK